MSSFTLSYCSSRCFVVGPHNVNHIRDVEDIEKFHIYLICRAPRVRLIPDSIRRIDGRLMFQAKIGGEFSYEVKSMLIPEEWKVHSFEALDAGGRTFKMVAEKGISTGDFSMLWLMNSGQKSDLDHEVVYVGQAYGAGGRRNVVDRLIKHETLQKIMAEDSLKSPNTDIVVYGFQYVGNDSVGILFNGADKNLISDERDRARLRNVIYNPPDDKVMTQIVEAGLIRYFQPIYNKHFKDIFPNYKYNFLDIVKNLDYESFVVEINTEDLGTRLCSQSFLPGYHHIIRYIIKSEVAGGTPVDYFRMMDGTGLHPSSGPFY